MLRVERTLFVLVTFKRQWGDVYVAPFLGPERRPPEMLADSRSLLLTLRKIFLPGHHTT